MEKLFFYFFILCCINASSQNGSIDSLLHILKTTKEDTVKVELLLDIGDALKINGDPDSADIFSNSALQLSKQLNYKSGIAYSYTNLGNSSTNRGNYPDALQYYSKALQLFEQIKDLKGESAILNNTGIIYHIQSNYPEAIKNYKKVIIISQQIHNRKFESNAFSNIGMVYSDQGNYPEALKYYLMSLKISEEASDRQSIINTKTNIGTLYANQKKSQLAFTYYSAALSIAKNLGNKRAIGLLSGNIGNVYFDKKDYAEALKLYLFALQIRRETGDSLGVSSTLHNLALLYDEMGNYVEADKNYQDAIKLNLRLNNFSELGTCYVNFGLMQIKQKKYDSAEEYILAGLAIAGENGYKDGYKEAYSALVKLDSLLGNYRAAFEHYKLYTLYKDSLFNEENTEKQVQLQMQYEFEKKESVSRAEQEKKDEMAFETSRRKDLTAIALSGALALVLIISVLLLKQNKLRSEKKEMNLEQKLLRSQMNPHFIFNSLQAIQNYILKNEQKEAVKYLSSFATITRSVLENSRMELIPIKKEVTLLGNYLQLQKLRFGNRFDYTIHVDETIDIDNTLIPPMLSQPFIENALEHGMKDIENGGLIDVYITAKDNALLMEIKDNGTGLEFGKAKDTHHQSLATSITKERIALMNKKSAEKIVFSVTEAYPNELRKGVKVSFNIPFQHLTA